jgi:hypothetical protein
MLTIEYAKNPIYTSEDGQTIDLRVKFYEFAEEVPFGATPFDPMPHGIELYNRAKAGEFGPIAPYVSPNTPAPDQPVTSGTQSL